MARTLALSVVKMAYFLMVMFAIARMLGNPESYINYNFASKVAQLVSGDVNAESLYDAYFCLDVLSVVITTTVIYVTTMKLIRKNKE